MKNHRGFTLVELIITIAVFAILAALAAPNVVAWIIHTKLQGASREVLSAFQDARLQAIKGNAEVVVQFQEGSGKDGTYTVFVDNGAGGGTPRNDQQDGGEPTTAIGQMPAGVELEDAETGSITFTSRGFTKNFATLTVKLNYGPDRVYEVQVNGTGHAKIVRG